MPSNTTTSTPSTPATSTPGLSWEQSSADHELYLTRFSIHLLVVLCLGALASFSLAPHFLTQKPYVNITRSTYTDGVCTTQPQAIDYVQKTSTSQMTMPVPSSWAKAGKNSQQFALAQACAAAFTIAYETIDINTPASLSNATSMLSSTGKQHFFAASGTEPKDTHLDPTWQAQARKEHLQQSAQMLSKAQLQTVLTNHKGFSAIFITNYQLTTRISGKSTTQHKYLIVVLAPVLTAPSDISTGWQIVDWYSA